MIRNPRISSVQLATEVGISSTAIEKNLKFLKENGFIARIGPAKGGHWEVLK
jgi:ATP-dependent DNA helicase RecG